MTVATWLYQATQTLTEAGVATARLDGLVLLEDVLEKDRGWLLAHDSIQIKSAQLARLKKLLKQRAEHLPLAYVRGRTEFYGRDFVISPAVLEPRPESEMMIDLLKTLDKLPTQPKIADIGAGSGALGITAALEVKNSRVELLELDKKAVEIAQMNVDLFTLNLPVIQSDLLSQSSQDYDVLLCNLPYVPDDYQINLAALHEPRLAIFGGPDGLDLYRKLFKQTQDAPKQPLYILCESLPLQHDDLEAIATTANYRLEQAEDFIQCFTLE